MTDTLSLLALVWIADALEGDCDLEPEPEDMRPGPQQAAYAIAHWGECDDLEPEGCRPGFLHRAGHWVGVAP